MGKIFTIITCFLLSINFCYTQVSDSDSLALVDLYNSTDGENWNDNINWLTGSVDTWSGITTENNIVTKIVLSDNNLKGELPFELGNFTALKELDLSWNQLSGYIPSEIGYLNLLVELNLSSNNLSGSIPFEISYLTKLIDLDLYNNQLSGEIPSEIGELIELKFLKLSINQLSDTIPDEIGNLKELLFLGLDNNKLSGSVPNLSELNKLKTIYLDNNRLEPKDSIDSNIDLEQIVEFKYSPQDTSFFNINIDEKRNQLIDSNKAVTSGQSGDYN